MSICGIRKSWHSPLCLRFSSLHPGFSNLHDDVFINIWNKPVLGMFMKHSIMTMIYAETLINQAVDSFASSRLWESRLHRNIYTAYLSQVISEQFLTSIIILSDMVKLIAREYIKVRSRKICHTLSLRKL